MRMWLTFIEIQQLANSLDGDNLWIIFTCIRPGLSWFVAETPQIVSSTG